MLRIFSREISRKVAPEILNNFGYGCKVDIFSVGVIMYILLTSKFVFNAKDYNEILRKNK